MPEILTLLSCLTFHLNSTSLKHLGSVSQAMLAMSGRVTMLGYRVGRAKEEVIEPFNDFFTVPRTGRH